MEYTQVIENAKKNIGKYCKVCRECNGIACRGQIPGVGGKGLGLGFIRNYDAFRKVGVNMDTCYEPSAVDTSVELFGKKFKYPVFAGPVGAVQMHYSDLYDDVTYSKAVVKGCKEAGVIAFTGDGVKDEVFLGTLEAAKDNGGWSIPTIKPWSKEEVLRKVKMAEEAGAVAVAMDIDAGGLAFLAAMGKPVSPMSAETLKEIIASTELPFILKGIMTVAGAKKAVEAGAYGIVVSNHGGRVLDETPSTLEVLPEIVEAVGGKMKILIDGGVRSGLDVFKAIALGADAVLICRPYAVSVYGGDVEGVQAYTELVGSQLHDTMVMCAAATLKDITPDKVRSSL